MQGLSQGLSQLWVQLDLPLHLAPQHDEVKVLQFERALLKAMGRCSQQPPAILFNPLQIQPSTALITLQTQPSTTLSNTLYHHELCTFLYNPPEPSATRPNSSHRQPSSLCRPHHSCSVYDLLQGATLYNSPYNLYNPDHSFAAFTLCADPLRPCVTNFSALARNFLTFSRNLT